jgi:AraC-like DNA-binding protein
MTSGAYGDRLGSCFRLKSPPTLVTQTALSTRVAVTELRCDEPDHGLTTPLPRENAFLVAFQFRGVQSRSVWVDGRPVQVIPFAAGDTSICDLNREPVAYCGGPFHNLHFYFPCAALNEIAEDLGALPIRSLHSTPGIATKDQTLEYLATSLLPVLAHPEQASKLFVNHILLAACAHVAKAYGGIDGPPRPTRGGLAPWQERRAKELLAARLDGDVAVAEIARECKISVSHFARAFKQSTGETPHRWLLQRRVEAAKALMCESGASLSEVALSCGFADQSHLTKVFSRQVGTSPAAWRRSNQSAPAQIA